MLITREDLGKIYLIEHELVNFNRNKIVKIIDGEEWFQYDAPKTRTVSHECKFSLIEENRTVHASEEEHIEYCLTFMNDHECFYYDFENDDEWIIENIKKEIK